MTPPSTRFNLEANLRDIAEDDALLDALAARTEPKNVDVTRRADATREERSPSEHALDALLGAWTREIDATCDGIERPGRSADVSQHPSTAATSAHAATAQNEPEIAVPAAANGATPLAAGRYLAAGRPARAKRTRRAWSSRASLTALSAGAVVSLSSVAAAVNGGGLPNVLAPLHLDWSNARSVATSDVPHAQATGAPSPTDLPGSTAAAPTTSKRSAALSTSAREHERARSSEAGGAAARPSGSERPRTSPLDSVVGTHAPAGVAATTPGSAHTRPGTGPTSAQRPTSTGSSTSKPSATSSTKPSPSHSSSSKPSPSQSTKPSHSSKPSPTSTSSTPSPTGSSTTKPSSTTNPSPSATPTPEPGASSSEGAPTRTAPSRAKASGANASGTNAAGRTVTSGDASS